MWKPASAIFSPTTTSRTSSRRRKWTRHRRHRLLKSSTRRLARRVPDGHLHKLVHSRQARPGNEKWKERQIARVRDHGDAEKIEDATARSGRARAGAANHRHQRSLRAQRIRLRPQALPDRELHLRRGHPAIAVQIAKMRFFISLIVDQKIDDSQPNRGVRPLPNLETKFVAPTRSSA